MFAINHETAQNCESERRRSPRVTIRRPAKLYDPRSHKYYPCATCDLSAGGVLIELDHAIPASPGDVVHLAIAQKRRQPLLRQSAMIEARVVRTLQSGLSTNSRMLLAAEFPSEFAAPSEQTRLAA